MGTNGRKFNKKIPVLALSASVFMEVKTKINECGMNGFILKPFDPEDLLNQIQNNLFNTAIDYRKEHTTEVETFDEFKDAIENKGGFVLAHWDGTEATEDKIKEITKATIRCIPNDAEYEDGVCVFSGEPSTRKVLFAKAY